jgi:hypothetical protein
MGKEAFLHNEVVTYICEIHARQCKRSIWIQHGSPPHNLHLATCLKEARNSRRPNFVQLIRATGTSSTSSATEESPWSGCRYFGFAGRI